MKPPDSRDCPKCKTGYNTIYQCERCGSTWNIPDAPSKKDIVEKMADAFIARNGWHDAKTDPPKVGNHYLCYEEGYPMWVDYYILHKGKSLWEEGLPTHWMPLPEPPAEDKNG